MQKLITELLRKLAPALKSVSRADALLMDYFDDQIALIWTTADVHRAANENKTVLTEAQARELLRQLHQQHNKQHGLKWEDVVEAIQQCGLGRDIQRRELKRFIHQDVLTVDAPKRRERP